MNRKREYNENYYRFRPRWVYLKKQNNRLPKNQQLRSKIWVVIQLNRVIIPISQNL